MMMMVVLFKSNEATSVHKESIDNLGGRFFRLYSLADTPVDYQTRTRRLQVWKTT